jgi:hypothetical protein
MLDLRLNYSVNVNFSNIEYISPCLRVHTVHISRTDEEVSHTAGEMQHCKFGWNIWSDREMVGYNRPTFEAAELSEISLISGSFNSRK